MQPPPLKKKVESCGWHGWRQHTRDRNTAVVDCLCCCSTQTFMECTCHNDAEPVRNAFELEGVRSTNVFQKNLFPQKPFFVVLCLLVLADFRRLKILASMCPGKCHPGFDVLASRGGGGDDAVASPLAPPQSTRHITPPIELYRARPTTAFRTRRFAGVFCKKRPPARGSESSQSTSRSDWGVTTVGKKHSRRHFSEPA